MSIFKQLDGLRKGHLLYFLYEIKLLEQINMFGVEVDNLIFDRDVVNHFISLKKNIKKNPLDFSSRCLIYVLLVHRSVMHYYKESNLIMLFQIHVHLKMLILVELVPIRLILLIHHLYMQISHVLLSPEPTFLTQLCTKLKLVPNNLHSTLIDSMMLFFPMEHIRLQLSLM